MKKVTAFSLAENIYLLKKDREELFQIFKKLLDEEDRLKYEIHYNTLLGYTRDEVLASIFL